MPCWKLHHSTRLLWDQRSWEQLQLVFQSQSMSFCCFEMQRSQPGVVKNPHFVEMWGDHCRSIHSCILCSARRMEPCACWNLSCWVGKSLISAAFLCQTFTSSHLIFFYSAFRVFRSFQVYNVFQIDLFLPVDAVRTSSCTLSGLCDLELPWPSLSKSHRLSNQREREPKQDSLMLVDSLLIPEGQITTWVVFGPQAACRGSVKARVSVSAPFWFSAPNSVHLGTSRYISVHVSHHSCRVDLVGRDGMRPPRHGRDRTMNPAMHLKKVRSGVEPEKWKHHEAPASPCSL